MYVHMYVRMYVREYVREYDVGICILYRDTEEAGAA